MLNTIRDFIQRGRKGYASRDLWSFSYWLSTLIASGLREFKKNCRTYPSDGISWEEWMTTLDEMIECFEEQARSLNNIGGENFMDNWRKRREVQKKKLHRGLELLGKYWWDLR